MSLHRWSLPRQAFARSRSSSDNDPDKPIKFSTIHIGQPAGRRRVNLSSAFSSLFEKTENRQVGNLNDEVTLATSTKELQPLTSRAENILPTIDRKTTHIPELQVTTSSDGDLLSTEDIARIGTTAGTELDFRIPPFCAMRDAIAPSEHQHGETPKQVLSFGLSNSEDGGVGDDEKTPLSKLVERVRSTSSSYPSEGIRSPPSHCRSPEPTAYAQSLVSDLSRYGAYPSRASWHQSDVSNHDMSTNEVRNEKTLMEELVKRESESDSRAFSGDQILEVALCEVASNVDEKKHCSSLVDVDMSSLTVELSQQGAQGLSSNREVVVALPPSGSSEAAALRAVDIPYVSRDASGVTEDDTSMRISNVGSKDRLRPSSDTVKTHETTLCQPSQSNTPDNVFPLTIPKLLQFLARNEAESFSREPDSPRTSLSEASPISLVQRIRKMKFKKWMKKVCLKTKVRFDHAVKSNHTEHCEARTLRAKQRKRGKRTTGKKKVVKVHRVLSKGIKATQRGKPTQKEVRGLFPWHRGSMKVSKGSQSSLAIYTIQEEADSGPDRVQPCPTKTGL